MYDIIYDKEKCCFIKPNINDFNIKTKDEYNFALEHYEKATKLLNKIKLERNIKDKNLIFYYSSWNGEVSEVKQPEPFLSENFYKDFKINQFNEKHFKIMYHNISFTEYFETLDETKNFIDKNESRLKQTKQLSKTFVKQYKDSEDFNIGM